MSSTINSHANASNSKYLEDIYSQYRADPSSVPSSWAHFFQGMEFAQQGDVEFNNEDVNPFDTRISHLIQEYRLNGHLIANTNPLETNKELHDSKFDLESFGFSPEDLDKEFSTENLMSQSAATLRQIITLLKDIYCSSIGVEYIGIQSKEIENWFMQKMEPTLNRPNLNLDDKRNILEHLSYSELFETFLHTKYVGQKRFSLEGAEVLIPALSEIIDFGSELGINEVCIGMPHRGRLNVLANILKKSYGEIFSEFEVNYQHDSLEGSGDVKYHKGFTSKFETPKGKEVVVSLGANPSHLEAVDPVTLGKTRAKQVLKSDTARNKVLSLLVHGDASLSGQGVVYECLQMSELDDYSVGGTLHIVVNNQIGFTTKPQESRSSKYCTDVAKVVGAPVFHVNGDDPEAVIHVTRLAVEFLQTFQKDVFIDIICFRRHGHNEGDEPAFTSPLEYKVIKKLPSVRTIYRDQLISHGHLEKEIAEKVEKDFKNSLGDTLEEVREKLPESSNKPFDGSWAEFRAVDDVKEIFKSVKTGVSKMILNTIFEKTMEVPESFHMLPKLKRLLNDRGKLYDDKKLDWALAEKLAFGTLLMEGTHVRLSGQDCKRGTFSHRHAVWVDNVNGEEYFPLQNISDSQARIDVINSSLSEYAVMGFEYGYSLSYPSALVMWEAQFGDFANGAQIIIDQFFCTCEQKWRRFSGLTLLLPHGQEGQGPEHSSARIERFLANSAQNNIQVAMPTTPAQMFHLLRRQAKREWRRPLVVATPKAYLRHPLARSKISEIEKGAFKEVLADPKPPKVIKKMIFCSGKVYFDLIQEREKRKAEGVVIHRLEQIYPFHRKAITDLVNKVDLKDMYWVQEEPLNQGANLFVKGRFIEILPKNMKYRAIGRQEAASPAVGSMKAYEKEYEILMNNVFGA